MNESTAIAELTELARKATWGLMKGGDLDCFEDGKAALLLRWDILDAADRAGIEAVDRVHHGIGEIYTRAEVESR